MKVTTFFENIQDEIIINLKKASHSIKIALAYFTDKEIFEILCEKAQDEIAVELIISDEEVNFKFENINFDLLVNSGGKLFISVNEDRAKLHNKFCILDDNKIITGSYNWSYQAKKNHENIVIIEGFDEVTDKFKSEFERIKIAAVERKRNRSSHLSKTGIEQFDQTFGGLYSGTLNIITSSLQNELTNLLLNFVNQGMQFNSEKIAFISLSEDNIKTTNRLLSICSGIPLSKIESSKLSEHERNTLYKRGILRLQDKNFILKEIEYPSINQLKQELNVLRYKHDLGLFILDRIERISVPNSEYFSTELKNLELTIKELKRLALEINVPIVCSINLQIPDKRKSLVTDSREFSVLENYADTIFILSKPEFYDNSINEFGNRQSCMLKCIKNRHGVNGTIQLDEISLFSF